MARVNRELGDDLIEWAAADGRVILLQAKRGAPRRPPASPRTGAERVPAAAAGAARLVHAFAGPLGEALVLPVLLAGVGRASTPPAVPAPAQLTRAAAQAAWAAARARSGTLRARAWGERDRDGGGASAILAALRGGEVAGAVDRLAALPAPGATDVAALLLDLGTVAAWMAQTALISTPDQLWAMTVDGAARHLAAAEPARTAPEPREARRRALLRWEPFVHTAVAATGTALAGDAVSAGTGAGPAVVVPGLPTAAVPLARMVVVAPHPIPQLAPLLWGAAGLVTAGGGASAHLVEVARSRGVPAVLGCDGELLFALLGDGAAGPRLVAVDGDGGRVVIDARP
jgi:phosphohistidine swiveling domain-containing protein